MWQINGAAFEIKSIYGIDEIGDTQESLVLDIEENGGP